MHHLPDVLTGGITAFAPPGAAQKIIICHESEIRPGINATV